MSKLPLDLHDLYLRRARRQPWAPQALAKFLRLSKSFHVDPSTYAYQDVVNVFVRLFGNYSTLKDLKILVKHCRFLVRKLPLEVILLILSKMDEYEFISIPSSVSTILR